VGEKGGKKFGKKKKKTEEKTKAVGYLPYNSATAFSAGIMTPLIWGFL
jgi:hypothetical protein